MISAVQQFQLADAAIAARPVSGAVAPAASTAAVFTTAAGFATAATSNVNGFGGGVCTKGWTLTRNVKPVYAHMGHDAGMYIPTQRPRVPM